MGFINSELTDLRELLAENLVQKTRVLALERERARLEGVIGRAVADIAKAQNDIGEAHLQIEQLHKKFSEDVNDQILQVRQKIADLREKTDRIARRAAANTNSCAALRHHSEPARQQQSVASFEPVSRWLNLFRMRTTS